MFPLLANRHSRVSVNVDLFHCPGHRIKAGCIERGLYRRGIPGNPEWRIEGGAAALGILRLVSALLIGIHWRITCGQAEIGCPLKDIKMLRLLRDDGYRLNARRAGANHAYA